MQAPVSIATSDTLPHDATGNPDGRVEMPASRPETKLQDLIPIVMVIVGGCEPCAEKTIKRALEQGRSWQDIDKTLRIVANMQRADCFAKAVGTDVIGRMEKPLAAGWRSLREAMPGASK